MHAVAAGAGELDQMYAGQLSEQAVGFVIIGGNEGGDRVLV